MKPNKRRAVFEIKKLLCDIFVLSLHNADDCAAYHCPDENSRNNGHAEFDMGAFLGLGALSYSPIQV